MQRTRIRRHEIARNLNLSLTSLDGLRKLGDVAGVTWNLECTEAEGSPGEWQTVGMEHHFTAITNDSETEFLNRAMMTLDFELHCELSHRGKVISGRCVLTTVGIGMTMVSQGEMRGFDESPYFL